MGSTAEQIQTPGTAVTTRPDRAPRQLTAEERQEREQRESLRTELTRYVPSFAKVIPAHLTPERLVTLTLVAATKTPKLFECTIESIALAVMRVGQWGLDIGTTAHLVPFRDKQANGGEGGLVCTPIADWKGKVELMYRAGIVRKITPRAVYAHEHFRVRYGLDELLEHSPIVGTDAERGAFVRAYAIAWLRGGVTEFEVMTKDEIERVRLAAVSKDSPAWKGHYAEMGRKTTVHRLAKRLPQSPQLRDAVGAEDAFDGFSGLAADPALAAERERLLEVAAGHQRALPARGRSMTWQHARNGDLYDDAGPQADPASGVAQGAPALDVARPSGADPYATQPTGEDAARAAGADAGGVMTCCGKEMWDNRQGKRNPKAPDFKCKENGDHVVWLKDGAIGTDKRPAEYQSQHEAELPLGDARPAQGRDALREG